MSVSHSSYLCKTGQADEIRLNAQAQLTIVPLRESINKWMERLNIDKILTLIDFGCGVGSSVEELKTQFPKATYIGIDRSPEQIDVAKKAHPDEIFMVGDENSDTADQELRKADLVYMQFVAMHQPNIKVFLETVISKMKPDAQLLIFEPYSDFDKIERHDFSAVDETQKARFELNKKAAESVGRTYNAVTLIPNLLSDIGMVDIAEHAKEDLSFPLDEIRDSILIPNWKTVRDNERLRSFITDEQVDLHISTLQNADENTIVYLGDARVVIARKPA